MLDRFLTLVIDAIKLRQMPKDEREYLTSNLQRLKSINSELRPVIEQKSQSSAVTSLFEAIPGAASERRSIGHWHMLSAAAAREARFKRIERSYEQDFKQAIAADFDSLISQESAHKALTNYMNRSTKALVRQASEGQNSEVLNFEQSEQGADANELRSLLFKMASEGDARARISVASDRNAPIAAMWRLCKDSSAEVRLALVKNDRVPLSVLRALMHDKDDRVKRGAMNRFALQSAPIGTELSSMAG